MKSLKVSFTFIKKRNEKIEKIILINPKQAFVFSLYEEQERENKFMILRGL